MKPDKEKKEKKEKGKKRGKGHAYDYGKKGKEAAVKEESEHESED